MDNINIYKCEQGSEQWYDLRTGRITASKFSVLMSGKSTKGYKDLVHNAVGEIFAETKDETYTNEIMQRGVEMESEAALEYEHVNGVDTSEVGFITNNNIHPEYFGVSPDRLVENGGIEIKCPLIKTHIGYLMNGKLPNEYKWQVQGQILISEFEFVDFMSYYPGIKPFILRVLPDKEMHEQMLERMEETVELIKDYVEQINNM